jgi:hypothetical protein
MYHDEFVKRPVKRESFGEDALPAVVLEVGGGLWMALAASLNQTAIAVLFQLGGLLPLVACSGKIFAHRCSDALARLGRPFQVTPTLPVPIPHFGLAAGPVRARRDLRAESARAGFDHSGRLG